MNEEIVYVWCGVLLVGVVITWFVQGLGGAVIGLSLSELRYAAMKKEE